MSVMQSEKRKRLKGMEVDNFVKTFPKPKQKPDNIAYGYKISA
jgi:hypothetical protein